MKYNFDEIVDRHGTRCLKWDLFDSKLPMWIADMDFKTAPAVVEALEKRAAHGVFGYTFIDDEWVRFEYYTAEGEKKITG